MDDDSRQYPTLTARALALASMCHALAVDIERLERKNAAEARQVYIEQLEAEARRLREAARVDAR